MIVDLAEAVVALPLALMASRQIEERCRCAAMDASFARWRKARIRVTQERAEAAGASALWLVRLAFVAVGQALAWL